MVIDAHAHLWRRARTPQAWIDPVIMPEIDRDFWIDDLLVMQDAAGIDGTILVQSANSRDETVDLLGLAERGGPVLGVVGWIDLRGDVPAQIEALRSVPGGGRLVGIRHLAHVDPDPAWLSGSGLDFDSLAGAGLAFDLVVFPRQLGGAVAAVTEHPGTRFVLDHLGNPPSAGPDFAAWQTEITALAELDNVYVKLSGILPHRTVRGWSIDDLRKPVDTALALFGPERMMFGSDWPLIDLAADVPSWIETVRSLIPPEHHEAVFGGNAERFYLEGQHA
jgi:L-fuconolactonase